MTDEQIMEIYALSRESFDGGQLAFQVQAFPFRMTAKNMARHRKNPHMAFWRMLKEGSDHFELTKQQPKIDVCEKRYVFNAHLLDPSQLFDARGKCPEYDIPEAIAVAARSKKTSDDREMALLSNLLPAAPIVTGNDGGTNQAFAAGVPARAPAPQAVAVSRPPRGTEVITGSTSRDAAIPAPQSNPRRTNEPAVAASLGGGRPAPAARPVQEEPRDDEAAQPSSPPQALPGTVPIRSTGGFSFR
jgi:hypothetical protein